MDRLDGVEPRALRRARSTGGTPVRGHYGAEGRSPGLRVVAAAPAFPSLLRKLSDTKWNRRSPLTVAGAAPDSAQKGTTGFPS